MNGVLLFLSKPTSVITKGHVGTSRSSSPTKDLPPPPSTGFTTRGLFIPKIANPHRPFPGPSSTNSSPTTTPPPLVRRKTPLPELKELPYLPPDVPPHPPTNGVKLANTLNFGTTQPAPLLPLNNPILEKPFSLRTMKRTHGLQIATREESSSTLPLTCATDG
jgi:hypothetical protein